VVLGDCLATMRTMASASVDAVVTDPPYGLSFMGKKWDYDVPAVEVWAECLRVLKPGGHLLAFAGTRTQHRMAVRIEDAGFEIRDMIAWVYGSGFPKSLDVSKAIDKAAGAEREVCGEAYRVPDAKKTRPHFVSMGAEPGATKMYAPTTPTTPTARQWSGWGTALKPAMEPITVARKPLDGTVAANVLRHGTGAINIDGTRVGTRGGTRMVGGPNHLNKVYGRGMGGGDTEECGGRWPANLIHDGSGEVVEGFPSEAGGGFGIRGAGRTVYGGGLDNQTGQTVSFGDTGSAARFFYCPKADGDDRDDGVAGVAGGLSGRADGSLGSITMRKNIHPTVKPTDLMRYLCRLVTPPGGVVLDPFCGSGSTGRGALLEGFAFVGCEMAEEYAAIAAERIEAVNAAAPLFTMG
jgi:hypothetical protein